MIICFVDVCKILFEFVIRIFCFIISVLVVCFMNCNSIMFIVLNFEKGFFLSKMKKSDFVLLVVV